MRKFILMPELYDGYFGSALSLSSPLVKIMLELPPEATGFYCGRDYSAANPQLLEELSGRGVPIVYDSLDGISPDTVVLADPAAKTSEKFAKVKSLGAKILFYLDVTEEIGYAPSANEFFLYTSETQMFLSMSGGRFSLDAQGSPEVGLRPDGGQAGAVGLLRGSILEGREEEKAVLKARLAEIMGREFHPKLPLALHFMTHHNVLADVDRGLSLLGNKVNVLIKNLDWHGGLFKDFVSGAKGKLVFVFKQHSQEYNRLLRFASDVFMPGCFGGALPTSLMLGIRLIPVYTQHVYASAALYQQKMLSSFSQHMRTGFLSIPVKIMDYLPPICINATDMLHDRIFDCDYWKKYDQQLPQIQRAVFGRYLLGEAALQRAKGFIVRLLQYGSFLPPNANAKDFVSVTHPLNTGNAMPPL